MPVPTLVTDLSTTLASNSPSGSDNVFPDLDNYLRAISAFIASIRDNSGNGWVSPYLPLAGGTVTGATTFSSTVALNGALSGTGLTTYLASPPAIGGTTPNTGAFTTLAASSDLTLSGGTANGVLYLNGSKVATSGSALTFDGTNFATTGNANLGSGSKSTDTQLNFASDLGTQRIYLDRGTRSLVFYDATTAIENYRIAGITGIHTWGVGGSEQMRLNSTGMGIGTSSPTDKLDVQGNVRIGATKLISSSPSAGNYNLTFQTYSGGFYDRMVLDYAGNLGLGTTPSAWATLTAFELNGGSLSAYSTTQAFLSQNAYYNAGWKYKTSAKAMQYLQDTNGHQWYTAPSGTAGNAISFTQALTLDANCNLLLNGTTAGASSVGTFTIFNGTAPTGSVTDGVILFAQDIASSSELRVRDEAGNVTTLSPHNFSLIPEGPSEEMAWAYYSEKGGKRINVDMLKLARMVEKLTGEKLVYES